MDAIPVENTRSRRVRSRRLTLFTRKKSITGWKGLISIPLLLCLSIAITIGIEWMQRESLYYTLLFVKYKPALFALNALVVFAVSAVIMSIAGSLVLSAGISFLLLFSASLISFFKTRLRGEPFYPWDVLLNKEGMNIAQFLTNPKSMIMLLSVLLIGVLLIASHFWLPRIKPHWSARIVLCIVCCAVLYNMGVRTTLAWQTFYKAGVSEIVWDQKSNYNKNGTPLAFTMNVRNMMVDKPEGYSEELMASIAKRLLSAEGGLQAEPAVSNAASMDEKRPNVIFIMNEAFWDPTLLPKVAFNEDPVPTLHQLQKNTISGYMLSPQFGGGTSNVEWEVLTGNSMSFLPGGSVPYQQYIHQSSPSLASYFKHMGYKSVGIHSYDGWFWSRDRVYRELGFDSFISKEYFKDPEVKGLFISDDEVSRHIIDQVESTEEPVFIYAITMQNHGPYEDNRYGETSIKASGELTKSGKQMIETFAEGARDADASLQMLIDHFEQSDEPTVIVFFGDHLPMLGMNYQAYIEGGFIGHAYTDQWALEEVQKMYSTPFVVWSSEGLEAKQVPVLGASFLGSNVLHWLDLPKTANFALNYELSQRMPAKIGTLVVDGAGQLHASVPEELKEDVESYRQLQYDLMFGNKHLAKYIDAEYLTRPAPAQEEFNAGLAPVEN